MRFPPALFHPRYWLLWLGFGILYVMSFLPYRVLMAIGHMFGLAVYHFAKSRRHIAQVNVSLCFPDMDKSAQQALVKKNIIGTGKSALEMLLAWWASPKRLSKLCEIEGLEHLEKALELQKGALLLSCHFTTLEIGGRMLADITPVAFMYRQHKNPLYDAMQKYRREAYIVKAVHRNDVRDAIKTMRKNIPVWYAADQDYGKKHSVFAPFYGQSAATLTATSRFVKASKAPLVPFYFYRKDDGSGYKLVLKPAVKNFPTGDDVADATIVNQLFEEAINVAPDQYLWMHRRFKTQPEGKKNPYSG